MASQNGRNKENRNISEEELKQNLIFNNVPEFPPAALRHVLQANKVNLPKLECSTETGSSVKITYTPR